MNCIIDEKACVSCKLCQNTCDKMNIEMRLADCGFLLPKVINPSVCVNCSKKCSCTSANKPNKNKCIKAYAVQINDKDKLLASTSGGAFSMIANYVFENKGVVYGAVYDENLNVIHKKATNFDELEPMKGSKYVQSNLDYVYKNIREDLQKGLVLFVGLPCQVAAIRRFTNDNENLITADLVCSGVPSPELFKSYIVYTEKKHHIKIIDYKFRDKHEFGLSHTTVITYKNRFGHLKKKTIKDRDLISYYVAFGKQNCYMKKCYSCDYNTIERVSDFTLGGFWNIGNVKTNLSEYDGISLVLSCTPKSEKIVEFSIRENFANIEEHEINESILQNPAIYEHTDPKKYQKDLYNHLKLKGYKKTSNLYFKPKQKQSKCKVLNFIKRCFRFLRRKLHI